MFDINAKKNERYPAVGHGSPPFVVNHFDYWRHGLAVDTKLPLASAMPTLIAVGGGKGGVGKSIISANFSAILAQFGYRVLVIDMDLGCSNIHSHFGVSMPKKSLADFILSQRMSFRDVILPAPVPGVAFVAGGREEQWNDVLDQSRKCLSPLWHEIVMSKQQYKVDFVILDLGAGTHRYTMDFFCASHMGMITVLPEPTSIENAYVFLKMVLWNLIEAVGKHLQMPEQALDVQAALNDMSGKSLNQGYAFCLRHLQPSYPEIIQMLGQVIRSRYIGLLLNQTRDQSDMDIGNSMEHICQRYFGLQSRYLGHLNYDQAVLKSLRNRRLLVSDFPHSSIVKRLVIAASQTLNLLGVQRRG
ncbi:MAG: AAA family ATPase [Oligoflexus sp.]